MSSTQDSDVGFRDWFTAPKWKTMLYVGLPILGASALCLYLYKKRPSCDVIESKIQQSFVPDEELTPSLTPLEQSRSCKQEGNNYFKAKKYEEAIDSYTKAISLCPEENSADLAVYHQNRAAAYEQLEKYNNVVEDCTQALKLNKKYTKAFLRRAKAYEKLDQKQECLQDLTAVSMIEGMQNSSWMTHMDQILKAIGTEKAAEHFKKRPCILPSNIFIKAYLESFSEDVVFDLVFGEEDMIDNPLLKAVQDAKEENYDNIISLCLSQIDKPDPNKYLAEALCLRGTFYVLMSMHQEALKDFERLLSLEDASVKLKVNALVKRATVCLQDSQNPQDSYDDFNKAIKLDPNNSDIYFHRGQVYSLTEKLTEAKEDFERCIELNDNFIPVKVQLAFCVYKTAMMQQSTILLQGAKRMFKDLIAEYPDFGDAYSLYAQLNQEMQDFEAAEKNFDLAISVEPKNPVHFVYKSLLMCQWKQDIEKAIALLIKAVEIDPKCDFAYETLATLQVQRGDFTEAISNFDKALDLVRSETEMARTFSIRQAALAQVYVTTKLGLTPPRLF